VRAQSNTLFDAPLTATEAAATLIRQDADRPRETAHTQRKAEETMPPGYLGRDDRRGIVRVAA
jgi:hypothetical protein